jgi:carbon-monoxide dehydrogenase medium subunit
MAMFHRKLPRFSYVRTGTIEETIAFLSERRGGVKLLAGGTDLLPQLRSREISVPQYVVDLKTISDLDEVGYDQRSGLKIGALVTIAAVEQSSTIRHHFPILAQAASVMASPQVRNRGTFSGNLCSAVPSADSAPSLLALDATALVRGPKGERAVRMDQFFRGPRETVLEADEMMTEISVPPMAVGSRGVYLKLSPRHSMDLAVVGVAVVGRSEDGVCKDVRIALGAVAPTPVRAPMAEAIILGNRITPEIIDEAAKNAITQCSPINDHRASAEYRCDMVYVMTRRALRQVFGV